MENNKNKLDDSMLDGVTGGFDSTVEVEVAGRDNVTSFNGVMGFEELQKQNEMGFVSSTGGVENHCDGNMRR